MSKSTSPTSMQDYQVESDVRTLAEAEKIKDDPKRFKAAQKRAKEMLEDLQDVIDTKPDNEADDKK
jgi:hypothetical protein